MYRPTSQLQRRPGARHGPGCRAAKGDWDQAEAFGCHHALHVKPEELEAGDGDQGGVGGQEGGEGEGGCREVEGQEAQGR